MISIPGGERARLIRTLTHPNDCRCTPCRTERLAALNAEIEQLRAAPIAFDQVSPDPLPSALLLQARAR